MSKVRSSQHGVLLATASSFSGESVQGWQCTNDRPRTGNSSRSLTVDGTSLPTRCRNGDQGRQARGAAVFDLAIPRLCVSSDGQPCRPGFRWRHRNIGLHLIRSATNATSTPAARKRPRLPCNVHGMKPRMQTSVNAMIRLGFRPFRTPRSECLACRNKAGRNAHFPPFPEQECVRCLIVGP